MGYTGGAVRRLVWFALTVVTVSLLWVVTRPRTPVFESAASGQLPLAPSFVLDTLDGKEFHLAELRGKPVVLNFWASWCVPCRAEMPVLVRAWERHRAHVHFVGVNVLDDPEDARRFVRQFRVPFPSVYDPKGDTLRWYRVVGLPSTAFVTKDGRLLDLHAGPFLGEGGEQALERGIREVLAR